MDHHTLVGRREEGKWRMGGSNQLVEIAVGEGKKTGEALPEDLRPRLRNKVSRHNIGKT
jgi:hypothetical protein